MDGGQGRAHSGRGEGRGGSLMSIHAIKDNGRAAEQRPGHRKISMLACVFACRGRWMQRRKQPRPRYLQAGSTSRIGRLLPREVASFSSSTETESEKMKVPAMFASRMMFSACDPSSIAPHGVKQVELQGGARSATGPPSCCCQENNNNRRI